MLCPFLMLSPCNYLDNECTQHKMYVLRAGGHTFRANQMPSVSLCCYSKNRNDIRNRTFVFKFAHRIYGFFSNGAAERQRTCKLLTLSNFTKKPKTWPVCHLFYAIVLPARSKMYTDFHQNLRSILVQFRFVVRVTVYLKMRFTLPNERR